ncbi:hypothetical protein [Mesorhizobium sp. M0199]|uniref:hypothetical protein n=1 Tax=Mesorhizobium sp. M0199 TaxID=2956911 RepID=UPI0033371533
MLPPGTGPRVCDRRRSDGGRADHRRRVDGLAGSHRAPRSHHCGRRGVMTAAIVENGTLVVSVGDFAASIAAKSIEHQFDALTHFPDRRANIELDELAARLNDFAAYVEDLAGKGDIAPEFNGVAEVEAFARRHIDLARRFWTAEGRCMNWFITGPARFPVAQNEKRMKVADARRADLTAHQVKARKAVKRKALPHGADDEPIRSGDPAAVEKIKAKIEVLARSIDKAKPANAIIRRMEKDGADDAAMIKAVVAQTGMSAAIAVRGVVLADWQWKRGFDTSGNRAEIRRLQSRLNHWRGCRSGETRARPSRPESEPSRSSKTSAWRAFR